MLVLCWRSACLDSAEEEEEDDEEGRRCCCRFGSKEKRQKTCCLVSFSTLSLHTTTPTHHSLVSARDKDRLTSRSLFLGSCTEDGNEFGDTTAPTAQAGSREKGKEGGKKRGIFFIFFIVFIIFFFFFLFIWSSRSARIQRRGRPRSRGRRGKGLSQARRPVVPEDRRIGLQPVQEARGLRDGCTARAKGSRARTKGGSARHGRRARL